MTQGWGRDYAVPESSKSPDPSKNSLRSLLVAGLLVVAVVWTVLGNLRDEGPVAREPVVAATPGDELVGDDYVGDDFVGDEIEILPRHAARVDDRGFAVPAAVGDWDVAVLATDRDAKEDWTEAQMEMYFDAAFVMTTLYVKYNGDAPAEFTEAMGWLFGNTQGTSVGYDPWDDWCPPWRDSALAVGVILPGEARIVRVCVPVHRVDAEGLEMDVEANPGYLTGPVRAFELPSDGVVLPAPEDVSTHSPYSVAVAQAADSGAIWGVTYTPRRSWIVSSATAPNGETSVRVAATFAVEREPGDTDRPDTEPEIRAPSGRVYPGLPCESPALPGIRDFEAAEVQVCWDVLAEDAQNLVTVIADAWGTGEWVVLRIPETTEAP